MLVPGLPAMWPLGLGSLLREAEPPLALAWIWGHSHSDSARLPSMVLGWLLNPSPDSVLGTEHPQREAFKLHSGIHWYRLVT